MKKLIFDADGFCVGRVSGTGVEGYAPPPGREDLPLAAYYLRNEQVLTGNPMARQDIFVTLGTGHNIQVPANTKLRYADQKIIGPSSVTIEWGFSDTVVLFFGGAQYGEVALVFQDYIAKRKAEYPPVPEQLEMIQEQGLEAWRSFIAGIKAKYPKPS